MDGCSGLGGMVQCISLLAEMATKSATAALRGGRKALAGLSKLGGQDCPSGMWICFR